ncbi:MAG: V-type ATPase 116kDa subunit family protein, partial [Oscillospiraceae bacterium]|nr:V-type ATPase 116kDa subunit family protein [Oscillospiraceae bacterium]
KDPQEAFEVLAKLGCFHPDGTVAESLHEASAREENPYEPVFVKAKGLLQDLHQKKVLNPYKGAFYRLNEVTEFLDKFVDEVARRNARKAEIQNTLAMYEQTRTQLYHLTGLTTSVDEIFGVKFLKVRFGRLPKDSYVKLDYYADKQFNFTSYDFDGEFYWGVYFTPVECADEADEVFASLYFERIYVPEFVHGTPQDGLAMIMAKEGELNAELGELEDVSHVATEKELDTIRSMTSWLGYNSQIYEMHRYAIILDTSFLISGFIPEEKFDEVAKAMSILEGVKVSEDEHEELPCKPPVKLKNNWFARPFEMFVDMYGLPGYGDIDPTAFVAISYSILFGIMFGDIGQGLLLGLIGYFIMYKKMHMGIGLILTRCSIFSVFFGFVYGSVFGFEEALNPLYHALGMAEKPLEVMSPSATNFILLASIGFGVVIIICAICIGVYGKFKKGIKGVTITGVNGIAGLIFYTSVVLTAVKLLAKAEIPFVGTVPFYIICLAVPFLLMFLSEPISALIEHEKIHEKPLDIFINGFFEMFDAMLSYASNTMSFLRVGGFVLAHAGMMSVVFTLANMSSGVGYILIVVIGNLFVMALEGLFVGIQVLRLEFYEVFSRFFEADGVPYAPLTVNLTPKD